MAKNKLPLTPEELAAKKERNTEKRKIFGETFIKALAIMLSIVLVYSVVYVAFGQGMTVIQKVTTNGTAAPSTSTGTSSGTAAPVVTPSAGTDTPASTPSAGTDTPASTPSAGTDTPAASTPASGTETPAAPSENGAPAGDAATANDPASVAALINKVTGEAVSAKAGYDWERHCTVNDIDVGSATNILNKIIQGVDSNADLNSVVGGFLGRGDRKETVPQGKLLSELTETNDEGQTKPYYHGTSYTLKATQLKAEDITNLQVNGDTYTFVVPNTANPGRDAGTPLARFTNDIVVKDEVNKEIQEQVGSAVTVESLDAQYSNIKVSVTIKDGKLAELSYSYRGDAKLGIKAAVVTINGSGNLLADAKYSNFKY